MKQKDAKSDTQHEPPPHEDEGPNSAVKKAPSGMDIDIENEIEVVKLLLIHTGICLLYIIDRAGKL